MADREAPTSLPAATPVLSRPSSMENMKRDSAVCRASGRARTSRGYGIGRIWNGDTGSVFLGRKESFPRRLRSAVGKAGWGCRQLYVR
eukprot:447818-Amorphochlora_amoeboformis.AAC.2